MSLPKIKAVLYTNKTYKDGTHPIMIRITQNRKTTYQSVGYSVAPQSWDEQARRVFEKKPTVNKGQEGQLKPETLAALKIKYREAIVLPNAKVINAAIDDKMALVGSVTQKLKVNDESLDAKHIKAKLKPSPVGDRAKSFLVFAEEYQNKFLKAGSVGTYRRYKSIIKKLKTFLGRKDLLFADITPSFLETYQTHLIGLNNKVNTIHNNLKSIKAIYYAAIAQELISAEKNPFFVFKLKADNSVRKEKLTIEEIIAIEKLHFPDDSLLKHCQRFFLFSFYCAGVRASDMLLMKWVNVKGNDRLEYQMEKTGKFKSISLVPKAMAILLEYRSNAESNSFIFPFMKGTDEKNIKAIFNKVSSSTALINKYLKTIADEAKIEKALSTHIARHSFSDIARKRKTSIYDISKMLNHSSIKITEAYLASLDVESQDEAIKNVLDF